MNTTSPSPLWVDENRWGRLAQAMVEDQLHARGINDPKVLSLMRSVPRHLFIPDNFQDRAYEDCALPTQNNQTISQPYIVGLMCDLLDVQPRHRVLEIGTGSGYQTAILSQMAMEIVTLERDEQIARDAEQHLGNLAIDNVSIYVGDGTLGLPDHAPFDRISVTAGAPYPPQALLDQLADGGKMVIPIGDRNSQTLTVFERGGKTYRPSQSIACRFVPLVGSEGW